MIHWFHLADFALGAYQTYCPKFDRRIFVARGAHWEFHCIDGGVVKAITALRVVDGKPVTVPGTVLPSARYPVEPGNYILYGFNNEPVNKQIISKHYSIRYCSTDNRI